MIDNEQVQKINRELQAIRDGENTDILITNADRVMVGIECFLQRVILTVTGRRLQYVKFSK